MSYTETWRSAPGGDADTTTSSNAQHDQFNQSDTDEQHRKRHHVVFEPMPIIAKHHVHPYSNAFDNRLAHQHLAHARFRGISPQRVWFRGLRRKSGQRFAICGGNPAWPTATQSNHSRCYWWPPGSGAFRAVLHRLAAERAEVD